MLDWRATRIADALAKEAAAEHQLPPAMAKLSQSAQSAVKHYAMLLGRITNAANNFHTMVVGPDGQMVSKICRDSVDRPRISRDKIGVGRPQPKGKALTPRAPLVVKPWEPPAGDLPARSRVAAARRASSEQLHRRVHEIGQSLRPAHGVPTAAQRLAALRGRVLARTPLSGC